MTKKKPGMISPKALANALDIFGVQSIVADCKSAKKNDNAAVACAKAWANAAAVVDPTGLMTIAATFMQPTCGIDQKAEVESVGKNDYLVIRIQNETESTCIKFFSQADF